MHLLGENFEYCLAQAHTDDMSASMTHEALRHVSTTELVLERLDATKRGYDQRNTFVFLSLLSVEWSTRFSINYA